LIARNWCVYASIREGTPAAFGTVPPGRPTEKGRETDVAVLGLQDPRSMMGDDRNGNGNGLCEDRRAEGF
jgi:hypothetical protein